MRTPFRLAVPVVLVALLALGAPAHADPWPALSIPAANRASLAHAPARPPVGELEARVRHVADALASGEPDRALDLFLPREPFLAVKDMSGAAAYYDTLVRWFRRDLTALRATLPPGAPLTFVRFEQSSSCTWMTVGREANRLPYWSCYGSRLIVRAGAREVRVPVHVLINWGDRWYVTHLAPLHRH